MPKRALARLSTYAFVVFFHLLKILINVHHVAFDEHLVRFANDSVHADFLFADDGKEHREGFFGKCLAEESVKAHVGEVAVDGTCNHKLRF